MPKPLVDLLLDAAVTNGDLSAAERTSYNQLRERPWLAALAQNFEVKARSDAGRALPIYALFARDVLTQAHSRIAQDVAERADRARYAEEAAARTAQLAADAAEAADAAAADAEEARASAPTNERAPKRRSAPQSTRHTARGNVVQRG